MTNFLLIISHLLLTVYAALLAWASLLDSMRDRELSNYDMLSFYLFAIGTACTVISLIIRNRKWTSWLFLPFAGHILLTWYYEAELHASVSLTDTLIVQMLAVGLFYTLLLIRVNGYSAWSKLK